MKILLLALIGFGSASAVYSQTAEPPRYVYTITGTVSEPNNVPLAKITVCWLPAERPINGRIPCVTTNEEGKFTLTVKDTPDSYYVCASESQSPFLIQTPGEEKTRSKCSETLVFVASDESREVNIIFDE